MPNFYIDFNHKMMLIIVILNHNYDVCYIYVECMPHRVRHNLHTSKKMRAPWRWQISKAETRGNDN